MRPQKRHLHIILIGLVAATLSSCSRVKLAYNYGDWLLEIQAHKYLSLNSEADERLSDAIDAYFTWHRKEMLPRYSLLARRLAKGFRGEEKLEDNIREVMPLLNRAWEETVVPALPAVADALISLDEKGLKKLEASYAENNAKQRKLYLGDPEAVKARRVKRTLGYLVDFSGKLSQEQEKQVAEITLATRVPSGSWIEDRERRQKKLITMLRDKKDKKEIVAMLRQWWLNSRLNDNGKDPERMDGAEVRVFFQKIVLALSPEQRERAARRMEEYAESFDDLAGDPAGPVPKPTAPQNP